MFADLDETIRQLLIHHVPLNLSEVDVSFDAPDREWSGRLSRPTVNCFMYDVRENADLREAAWDFSRDTANGTVTRKKLPVRFNAIYNVTVWARAPEDEHRLLWRRRSAGGGVPQGEPEHPGPAARGAHVAQSATSRAQRQLPRRHHT